jgi:hypothetical protein
MLVADLFAAVWQVSLQLLPKVCQTASWPLQRASLIGGVFHLPEASGPTRQFSTLTFKRIRKVPGCGFYS